MLELLPPLNDKNLPWLDVIHPIVVHFVIAMALISVVFDLIGVLTRRQNLFEVSFWNLLVATVADRVTANTTVYAMNAKHTGLTEYTNFAFNSAAVFDGATLVANASGIFALGGDVDDAAIIDAYARLGISDFGTLAHKRVDMAYVGYRSDGVLRLRVITDEQESYDYTLATRDGDSLHGNRLKLGRGMRGTYWQAEVGNVAGADFEIDTLQLMAQPLSRKV